MIQLHNLIVYEGLWCRVHRPDSGHQMVGHGPSLMVKVGFRIKSGF